MMRDATNSVPQTATIVNAGNFVHDAGILFNNNNNNNSGTTQSLSKKTCLCNHSQDCNEVTQVFGMVNDARKGFVRIPRHHSKGSNEVRRAYLRHLLPDHPMEKTTPSKYIAVHHFDPALVLAHVEQDSSDLLEKKRAVPRLLTKEQVMQLGVNVDHCDSIVDQELGRVYIALPNYNAKEDAASILNRIRREESKEQRLDVDPMTEEEPSKPEEVITANNSEASATSEEEMNDLDKSTGSDNDALEESESMVAEDPVIVSPITAAAEQTNDAAFTTSEPQQPSTGSMPESDDAAILKLLEVLHPFSCGNTGTTESKGHEGTNDAPMMPPQESKAEDDDATATTGSLTVEGINSMEESLSEEPREKTKTESDKSSSAHECVTSADEKDVPRDSSKVTFATVTIREYPIIPGDNPGGPVATGVPLTIDWQHQREVTVQVDAYERKRPKRRNQTEFDIPPEIRLDILRKSGFSLAEIQKYTKRANLIRVSRRTSVGLSHMYPMSDAKERLIRGLCNKTFRKAKKQKEREFLQASLQLHHHYGFIKKRESAQLTEASSLSFDDEPVKP